MDGVLKARLPEGSTLATISDRLRRPEEFVRSTFGNMAGYYRDCQVRLDLCSNPSAPDYLIEMLIDDEDDRIPQSIAVFSGRSHKGQLYQDDQRPRLWSSGAMTWKEVQTLLGRLRGIPERS